MQYASSARSTWRAPASASEYTATVFTPRRCAVLITRQAISPRLAIRIFLNIFSPRRSRWICLRENGTYLSLFSVKNSIIVSVPCPPRGLPLGVGASLLAISDAIASPPRGFPPGHKLAPTKQFGFSTKIQHQETVSYTHLRAHET